MSHHPLLQPFLFNLLPFSHTFQSPLILIFTFLLPLPCSDRLGELERDKQRLQEQLAAHRRDTLSRDMTRDMDYWKKNNKSKNILKKGLKKLKGKIQVCVCACMYMFLGICVCTCVCLQCMCMFVHVFLFLYIHMYVCMFVTLYCVHKHT